jgi:hypothetical protein
MDPITIYAIDPDLLEGEEKSACLLLRTTAARVCIKAEVKEFIHQQKYP